jgi:hypothetical protein
MKTKILLTAMAVFTAGLVAAQAQSVYSANVVGYATQGFPASYSLMATPFSTGVSNGANEIYGSSLQDGMTFYTWNGAGYTATLYSPSLGVAFGWPTAWGDPNTFVPLSVPTLPPGQGYYLFSPAAGTNTDAGAVAINIGATNTVPMAASYSLVGSVLPLGGSVTNTLFNPPVEDGTTFYTWNGAGYTATLYSPSLGVAFGWPTPWGDPNTFVSLPPPSVSVGAGFFIFEPDANAVWTQTLPSN